MKPEKVGQSAKSAILAIADVKEAVAAFDRGEVNVFDALDAVLAAAGIRSGLPRVRRPAARPRRRAA